MTTITPVTSSVYNPYAAVASALTPIIPTLTQEAQQAAAASSNTPSTTSTTPQDATSLSQAAISLLQQFAQGGGGSDVSSLLGTGGDSNVYSTEYASLLQTADAATAEKSSQTAASNDPLQSLLSNYEAAQPTGTLSNAAVQSAISANSGLDITA